MAIHIRERQENIMGVGATDGVGLDDTSRRQREDVRQVDAIMGFEGFEKTADVTVLDAAVQAGKITLEDSTKFLVLAARLAGARSVMKAIGPDDLRHNQIAKHYAANVEELRVIAARCGPEVVEAFALAAR